MINTIGGCYHCEKCGYGVDDLVDRHPNIPPQTTEELHPNIPPQTAKAVKIEHPVTGSDRTSTPMLDSYIVVGDPYVGSDSTSAPMSSSYQIYSPAPIQYGWVCPKCGAVMSPDQKTCPFCSLHL